MDEKTNFIVYCIEEYNNSKGINGKNVYRSFNRYRVIDYIGLLRSASYYWQAVYC